MKNSSSPTQMKAGFDIAQESENGYYYFYCGDRQGRMLLRSKAYQARATTLSRMKTALRLAGHAEHYTAKKKGKKHYFQLVNRSGQEMARSMLFSNENELTGAIDLISKLASEPSENAGAPLARKSDQEAGAHRHSFRIDLYQREEGSPYSGRILHLLSEEAATFQGIDREVIADFISRHLHLEEQGIPGRASELLPLAISLLTGSNGEAVRTVESGQTLLHFRLSGFEKDWQTAKTVAARMTIQALPDPEPVATIESTANLRADGTAEVQLPGNYFPAGQYRVRIICNPTGNPEKTAAASYFFQVF